MVKVKQDLIDKVVRELEGRVISCERAINDIAHQQEMPDAAKAEHIANWVTEHSRARLALRQVRIALIADAVQLPLFNETSDNM